MAAGKQKVRRHTRALALTRRGQLYLGACVALFIVAYSAGNNEFLLAASLLTVLLGAGIFFVRMRRLRLAAVRSFSPAIVAAGGTTTVTIDVRNLAAQRTAAAQWRDRLPWDPWESDHGDLRALAPAGVRFATKEPGKGNTATLRYAIKPPRRGVFEIGPMLATFGDPFGLVRGEAALAGTQQLVVTPEIVDLHDAGLGFAAGEGNVRLAQRSMGGNDDDLMTREYRRGDALRRVHWRASARHGELMVRQEEQRSRPEIRLIVDTRKSGYSDASTQHWRNLEPTSETFEWVVRMVASLGVHLHRSGYFVHVVETAPAQIAAFGDASQWNGQDDAFLASLASIELVDGGGRDRIGPNEQPSSGALFAVIAEPDPAALEWILRQRRPSERAVAFVPVWSARAHDALVNAGWQCVVFTPGDDLVDVWSAVGSLAARS
jgi:uncharacterized protein (DUF58 family)